jgi:hypothetical protein
LLLKWVGKIAPMFALLLVALVSLPAESVTQKAPRKGTDNPFDLLNGYWSGGGTVAPGKGCGREGQLQGHLQRGGQRRFPKHALRWHRLQIQYQLQAHLCSGKISGSWRETTYDASGSVSGTAAGNTVHSISIVPSPPAARALTYPARTARSASFSWIRIAHSMGESLARAPAIRRFCRDPPIVSRSLWLVRRAVAELPQIPAMFSP